MSDERALGFAGGPVSNQTENGPVCEGGPMELYRSRLAAREIAYDPAQERAVELLERLHKKLRDYEPSSGGLLSGLFGFFGSGSPQADGPRGVYLCGDVGRGKSMLMDLFYETAPLERKRRVHFHAFMQEIHAAMRAFRDLPSEERRRRLRELGLNGKNPNDPIPPVAKTVADSATLLCFDELQVTDVADAMILGRLFEALFSHGVVMVCTSNRAPQNLYADGINRELFLPFIDLIRKEMDLHQLDARTDYRLGSVRGQKVYYTPLGPEADTAMDAAWRALTKTAKGTPCEVEVQGRRLPVPEAARGAARFSFADLCEQPLGAADYLSLAERFHTVFVDRIPALGPEKRNEARRFITLIDTLYEHRVSLVVSADAEPDRLYTEGDGSFEFARTASRLMEMQSADYMAHAKSST